MANKTPLRAVFNASDVATGLAEYQSGETIPLLHGGIGVALSIGSAGQVLKVNSDASALEFGTVEAVINIDGMTDGSGITILDADKFAISDGGTEKYVTASQLSTYIGTDLTVNIDAYPDGSGVTVATSDKLLLSDGGTEKYVNVSQLDTLFTGTTQTLTNKTLTTPIANAGIQLKNGSVSAGFLEFFEDSDNGTNKVTVIGPASTADVTITLPATTGTMALTSDIDDLSVDELLASALVTESEGISSNDNDTTLPTSAAVKDFVDTAVAAVSTTAISQGNSNVTVTDAGTGSIAVDLDGTDRLVVVAATTTTATGHSFVIGAASNAAGGKIKFLEGTDNGTNGVTLQGPASTADVTVTLPAAADTLVGKATTDTLTNKTLTSPVLNTGASGTAIKDEDNMSSDSNTHLATQQSIKAYVDAQVTAEDLDFQGDSGGALSIDLDSETLDIAGGTGIDTSGSSNTLTVAIDSTVTTLTGSQTLTNKILTAPVLSGSASAAGSILFKEDTDNGTNTVTLIGPASTADVIITLPAVTGTVITTANSDGAATTTSSSDADFVLVDDGGVMKKITTGNLGIVNSLGVDGSSFLTAPGTDGNFDLAKIQAQTGGAESGLTANAVDAFGIPTGSSPDQFDCMDPKFQTDTVDYGSGEAYAGA